MQTPTFPELVTKYHLKVSPPPPPPPPPPPSPAMLSLSSIRSCYSHLAALAIEPPPSSASSAVPSSMPLVLPPWSSSTSSAAAAEAPTLQPRPLPSPSPIGGGGGGCGSAGELLLSRELLLSTYVVVHSEDLLFQFSAQYQHIWRNLTYCFVGNGSCERIKNRPDTIVMRNLPQNIEARKELVAYTAWWALVKNNLIHSRYALLLEYDVVVPNVAALLETLQNVCAKSPAVISLCADEYPLGYYLPFFEEVAEHLGFEKTLGYGPWFPTSNHCVSRETLGEFVEWYDVLIPRISMLIRAHLPWYQERMFQLFLRRNRHLTQAAVLGGLHHCTTLSHWNFTMALIPPPVTGKGVGVPSLGSMPFIGRPLGIPDTFDWQYYLRIHPDLGRVGLTTEYAAKSHWIACGAREERRHHPTCHTSVRRQLHKYPNKVFVETGTYMGDGLQDALNCLTFNQFISFETSYVHYRHCIERFKNYASENEEKKIKIWLGSSASLMGPAIAEIKEPITFWLDGHYSADCTFDPAHVCPLLLELDQIGRHPIKTHTILMDDRRLLQKSSNGGLDGCFDITESQVRAKILSINPLYQFRLDDGYVAGDILVAFIPPLPTIFFSA